MIRLSSATLPERGWQGRRPAMDVCADEAEHDLVPNQRVLGLQNPVVLIGEVQESMRALRTTSALAGDTMPELISSTPSSCDGAVVAVPVRPKMTSARLPSGLIGPGA